MSSKTSSQTSSSRTASFRLIRPISLLLAGVLTLALTGEGSAAFFRFGGGMRHFSGARASNFRAPRGNGMRGSRNFGRFTRFNGGRRFSGNQSFAGSRSYTSNQGGRSYTSNQGGRSFNGNQGSRYNSGNQSFAGSRGYTGNRGGDNPPGTGRDPVSVGGGTIGWQDPGRWPRNPRLPIGRTPGYPTANPIVPLTPGPGAIIGTGAPPPPSNLAAIPPNGQGPGQPNGPGANQPNQNGPRAGFNAPPPGETRFVADEVLLNVPANITTPAFDAIAQRNQLTRLELRELAMTGRRIARVGINDGRAVADVIQSLQAEAGIAGAQPNYLFSLDQAAAAAADPMQYAYAKLHLPEAHALVKGDDIRVAVVDSMIDGTHPDLAGAIAATYDATGTASKPHFHGTGVAGVIAAHGKLTGAAPSVQILAVTAFGAKDSRGTSMDILKGLDWAGESKAEIVNMSFTGPADPEQRLMLSSLRQKGAVLIAAAGNAGPKSPPLYPAADPDVIAVTATDSNDDLYDHANRGSYIAVAAPGVAILVDSTDGGYQMRTGTSFAAPLVSGIAALVLQRNHKLDPVAVRSVLTSTAHHLGSPGQDDQFGSGLVDAMSAVESAGALSSDVSARSAQPAN